MERKPLIFLIAILFFLIPNIGLSAEDQIPIEPIINTPQFDLNVDSIPQDFQGDNIINLYKELTTKIPSKDEFESKEAYKNRILSYNFPDLYVFKTRVNSNYDVKKEKFNITPFFYTNKNIVVEQLKSSSSYDANNAVGGQVTVKVSTLRSFIINFDNHIKSNFQISSVPDEARALNNNLGVIAICKLKPLGNEYYWYNYSKTSPTFSYPYQNIYHEYRINVNLLELWVYNTSTGNVLAKESAK